jgi:hypothetical protein
VSSRKIFNHFLKDPIFDAHLNDGMLSVSVANTDGEPCIFFILENVDDTLGEKVVIYAPIFDPISELDLNQLFSAHEGPLDSCLAYWERFGLKVGGDELFFSKFLSSDQDPKIVRRQAVTMAFSAQALGKALRK